ncbi:MAG: transcription-repair coupling factor [Acutalibacteraceae bacterium]|jgi:transcription-repair coupling factor (superfamily II helicase)
MSCFSAALHKNPEYGNILRSVELNRLPMGVLGLSHIHKAHLIAALTKDTARNALVITPDESQALRLVRDLNAMGAEAVLYPARDFNFRSSEGQSREYEHIRLGVLHGLSESQGDIVVCSAEAALQLTIPPDTLKNSSITLSPGKEISPITLIAQLIRAGYVRADLAEGAGQFAFRGGILDIFPPSSEQPFRLEFWGDTIELLTRFDPDTQRSIEKVKKITVTPANEILPGSDADFAALIKSHLAGLKGKNVQKAKLSLQTDIDRLEGGARLFSVDRHLPLVYPKAASLFDYMPEAMLFVCESFTVKERAEAAQQLMSEELKALFEDGILCRGLDRFTLTWAELSEFYEKMGAVFADNLPRGSFDTPVRDLVTVNARQLTPWNGSLGQLVEDIKQFIGQEQREERRVCVVMAGNEKSAKVLNADLISQGIRSVFYHSPPEQFPESAVCVIPGGLSAGFEYPGGGFMLITYGSRTALKSEPEKKRKSKKAAAAFNSLEELVRGDYIVHTVHGIGIYEGISTLEAGGAIKDYIKIRYDKGDILYVPVTQLDQVAKYIGPRSEDRQVKLNKLGGREWQKAKSRVKAAAKDMARQLIDLYAKRQQIEGFAFPPDIDMQNDFETRFEFQETPDQLRCIDEVKRDMERKYPMDRLLCGDVGFGKTEVALRAAFKCVAGGKQCVFLVPTTILALQHYQTIKKRFEGFPVETAMLSRFCSPKEITKTLKDLRRGSLDIVVGTHRLISKDVKFRDPGLIIIDEEQRFGVAQKEKLKELFPSVDVLTLTATPIPRTLNMAMSGLRDMSILEEAPQDRHPVQTYIIEHDMNVIAQAVSAELRRGGQVYYLHNRIETIDSAAAALKELLPDARLRVAHGRMDEDELSETWRSLLEGEIDILVCTTIIETGIDVPNVNTLIIEDAHRLGLAQLHQIRGRVGRSPRRASAYLTFTKDRSLTEIAYRRLSAIREYTEFGSGFKIAMRDMELRGAGNILGAQQHGHLETVGYDMYMSLLAQAIREERGEAEAIPEKECLIDLQIDAHIPDTYIESLPQRLSMYRRIADIRNKNDAYDVIDELTDRFGSPPESVQGLITVALLRSSAIVHGVYEIGQRTDRLLLYTDDIDLEKVDRLVKQLRGRVKIGATGKSHISVRMLENENQLGLLTKVFAIFSESSCATDSE